MELSPNQLRCRLYHQKNREKEIARMRNYSVNNREKILARKKVYRERNKQRLKQEFSDWYYSNPEKVRTKQRRWIEQNREKTRIYATNERARRNKAEGKYYVSDVRYLLNGQMHLCACCYRDVAHEYHVDHIIPLSKGGTNWPHNLQILCPSCNKYKADRSMSEFMDMRGWLLL